MRLSITTIICSIVIFACGSEQEVQDIQPTEAFRFRLPYEDGTLVRISRDHLTHNPVNRLDMVGHVNTSDNIRIVAAQSGTVRFVEDSNTEVCCQGECANNYVWIEHVNGYWTKYSHLLTGSATDADIYPGKVVEIGAYLGLEADIGRACGRHLHFEVAIPNDENRPLKFGNGGFIDGKNIVPVFCHDSVVVAGNNYVAGSCD